MGKKPIVSVTYEDAMLLSPNSFDSQEPVPVAKDLFFLSQNEPKKKDISKQRRKEAGY